MKGENRSIKTCAERHFYTYIGFEEKVKKCRVFHKKAFRRVHLRNAVGFAVVLNLRST